MSDASDLRLNSLDRFRKRSQDLVLEEHGHCEVPAGCGGVVLRWVRRGQERSRVSINLDTRGEHRVWLDGEPLERGSAYVGPGPHLLAVEVQAVAPASAGLVQAAVSVTSGARSGRAVSRPDGTWRATTARPDEAWTRPGFDDGAWTPLVARPLPPPEGNARFGRDLLERHGAVPLGLRADHVGAVWIRATFRLDGGAP